jgi:hypothetical protein
MQTRWVEVQKKILQELKADIQFGKSGHGGALPIDVLTNTLRVTLQARPEEVQGAIDNLCRLQLVEKDIRVRDRHLLSITGRGREAIARL